MAFDIQALTDAARCAECLSPNQKQNVLLYLLNGILENGTGGGGGGGVDCLHNLLSVIHPDTLPSAVSRGSLIVGNATPLWAELGIGAAATVLTSDGTDANWTALPAGLALANPTAQVGLVAVNGVAATAMRSDAAPPLSQAIAPTWTSPHIFSPTAALAIQINPFGAAAGNTSEFRLLELAASGTNYTGFKAADAMAASEIYVLPDAAPSANRFLRAGAVAAGVSTLTWAQISLTADVTGILPVANGGTGTSTAFTLGSVIFAGAAGVLSQDNANLFWNDTNNRLGIGTASPVSRLTVGGGVTQETLTVRSGNSVSDATATPVISFFSLANREGFMGIGGNKIFIGNTGGLVDYNSATLEAGANITISAIGNVGFGNTSPAAVVHIKAGTATVNTAPLKFTSGTSLTVAVAGAIEFTTDDLFFTITTGAARKRLLMADPVAGLTSGRVPFATTNGRLTDDSGMAFSGSTLTITNVVLVTGVSSGQAALTVGPFGAAAGNTGEIRYLELAANGTMYTGFKAPDLIAASEIYVLPNAAPSANRFLRAGAVAAGVSTLSWAQVSLTADVTGILPVANGGSGTSTAFTAGSVIFAGAAGVYSQDNANLFWDDSANRLTVNQMGLPNTTSATVGGVYIGVNRTIHNFGTTNLFIGATSGNFTMTGYGNVGIGDSTLLLNTSGVSNVGIGFNALFQNSIGDYNNAIGYQAMAFPNTGSRNVAFGFQALYSNIAGESNIAIGFESMRNNDSGNYNFASGHQSLKQNVSGVANIAIGYQALTTSTTGSGNVVIGYITGANITSGSQNIAIGYNVASPTSTNSNTLTIGNLIFGAGLDGTGNALSSGNIGIGVITPLAKFHVTNSAAATVGCIIKAAAAQSANLTEWQSSAGVVLTCVDEVGNVGIGTAAPGALLHVSTVNATTIIAKFTNSSRVQNIYQDVGGGGLFTPALSGWYVSDTDSYFLASGATMVTFKNTNGNVGIGTTSPTAVLHIKAGTTAASTAPLKFTTGTSMTAAEAGAVEFTTDDLFFTITTGAARKRLLMADATAGLTSGKMPIATTNGRLIDLTASSAYTPTNVTTDRSYDANATTTDELADVLGTIIADLQTKGILG